MHIIIHNYNFKIIIKLIIKIVNLYELLRMLRMNEH